MKHLKSKISRALVLYIVLFSSVVTLCLTAIQLRIDYNEGINTIHQRFDQIKITNIDTLTQSLWTLDNESIQLQLNGLTKINDIIFVTITDANDKLIAQSGKINTRNILNESFSLQQEYRGKPTLLGTLNIVASKENIYQQLWDTVVIILISQAIKTFLVSIFVLFIFYYLITRHLEKISEHSSSLELTTKPKILKLKRKENMLQKDDELAQVVESINRMSSSIYDNYIELIRSQHELANREAKFSAMFNSITDAIIIADNERKIIQTNPAFHSYFGYDEDEIKNKTTLQLYANPDQYLEQGKTRYNVDNKDAPTIYEIEYRRKDGSIFPSETMGGPIKLPDEEQLGFIGIIRDITDRKLEEQEKSRLQKQLHQAQKMEAIGQLTGGIAHDFNNILTSILGYSDLAKSLVDQSSAPKLNQYIQRINIAGERARELVAQLLAFSRSSPGDPRPLKLPTLINDVTSLIQPTIPATVKLVTEIDDNVPSVMMDNTQMHQILMNLCINARDAMEGNGTLTIKLSYDSNIDVTCNSCNQLIHGDYVKLTVEDTGTGIQSFILDSMFEPFLTTKEIGKGTGMGLSVVHGILHKYKSHIVVETELEIGSRFHLMIPPIEEDITSEEAEDPVSQLGHDDGKGKHILVVDDEQSIAMFLQDFLETYDYKVTATTSSKEAVEFFKQPDCNFSLIITDQTMPELIGTEMIKQIFKIKPDIPVILCSGYNEQVGEQEAIELGCAKYLSKPIKNQLLIETIHEVLAVK